MDTPNELIEALAERYEIRRPAGEGGMATVYVAWDLKHKREVAVKVLRPELSASIGTDRFHQEIELAARLQHPHILPVYDSGAAGDLLYYVMPFVEGESLEEIARARGMPPADALRVIREVASALDYAHRQGIVHRDIKPANILLSQGHAVVADFGIARAVDSAGPKGMTQVGMAVGTPWYMSPEQATADPNVDGRSDIYALGCVLYELLEGKPPFDADTAQAVIAKTISAPMPALERSRDKIPNMVQTALERALAKNPEERFQTAAEFAEALEVGTGDLVAAGRPTGKARWLAGGVIAAIVGAAVLLSRGGGEVVASGADLIAVLPFDVAGAEAELGEGMVNLLSTNLDAVGEIQTVDARTVLQRWRARGGEDGLDLEGSLAVGRDAGAGSILLGSVVAAGSGVRLNAEMYTVEGEELARVQIDGDADNVFQLVDSLSLEVLRAIWQSNEPMPSFDVAAITSGSLEAVRAYMRGTLYFRQGRWDSSTVAFQEAVAIDSTFALAHLALSESYGWSGRHGSALQIEANATAFRFADRLPARAQLLVASYHLNRQGDPSSLDSIQRYTRRYPSDPRGWYALGDFQFHGMVDRPLSPEEQFAPFDRALELDSSMVAALVHPREIALLAGDSVRFSHYTRLNEQAGGADRMLSTFARIMWAEEAEARAALDSTVLGGNFSDFTVAAVAINRPALGDVVLDRIREIGERGGDQGINFQYAGAMVALLLGKTDRVNEAIRGFEAADQPNVQALGSVTRVLTVLAGAAADPALADPGIEHFGNAQGPIASGFLRALIAASSDDLETLRQHLPEELPGTNVGAQRYLALDGWGDVLAGDTATGVQKLRTAIDSLPPPDLGGRQLENALRLLHARVLAARPETREEGIKILRYGFDARTAPAMYTIRLRYLARALEAAGDLEGAAVAYADFIARWEYGDATVQPMVEAARQDLARVVAARS